jgi:hypothetical protein
VNVERRILMVDSGKSVALEKSGAADPPLPSAGPTGR